MVIMNEYEIFECDLVEINSTHIEFKRYLGIPNKFNVIHAFGNTYNIKNNTLKEKYLKKLLKQIQEEYISKGYIDLRNINEYMEVE